MQLATLRSAINPGRTLGLPKQRVRVALHDHAETARHVERARTAAGWQGSPASFVFTSATGGQSSHKVAVLRAFRKVVTAVGLDPKEWTPHEQHHAVVSVLSDKDVPTRDRSPVWSATRTRRPPRPSTGTRYGPIVRYRAEAMDRIFPGH